jgi:hypothetical protein
VVLVNAAQGKQVPGRKTDKADARGLAKIMRDGLLRASVIPPREQRALRDRTRYRTQLVQERSREVKRVQGVLERANIKLAAVATDSMGVSARAILAASVEGRADPATRAALAKRRRRSKRPRLEQALTGLVRPHHRQWLAMQLAHIDLLDEQIEALSAEITCRLTTLNGGEPPLRPPGPPGEAGNATTSEATGAPMAFAQAVALRDTIPGVNQRGGELPVAEWGSTGGALARPPAWRPGVASHRATMRVPARNARGRPAWATRPCAQACPRWPMRQPTPRGPLCRPCLSAWPPVGGRNAPSSPWPIRSWSGPSICSRARTRIGSWGPITLTHVGATTSSTSSHGGLSGWGIAWPSSRPLSRSSLFSLQV